MSEMLLLVLINNLILFLLVSFSFAFEKILVVPKDLLLLVLPKVLLVLPNIIKFIYKKK